MYEEQFFKALGKYADYAISNVPWSNPKAELTKLVEKAFKKQNPKDKLAGHGLNVGFTFEALLVAADALQARRLDQRRRSPTRSARPTSTKLMLGRADQVQRQGPGEGIGSACVQNRNRQPTVVLPGTPPRRRRCSRCRAGTSAADPPRDQPSP